MILHSCLTSPWRNNHNVKVTKFNCRICIISMKLTMQLRQYHTASLEYVLSFTVDAKYLLTSPQWSVVEFLQSQFSVLCSIARSLPTSELVASFRLSTIIRYILLAIRPMLAFSKWPQHLYYFFYAAMLWWYILPKEGSLTLIDTVLAGM